MGDRELLRPVAPLRSTYFVNEIFYSLQGEGARKGTANVFCRFAGCNLTCREETEGFDCDTEFASSVRYDGADALADAIVDTRDVSVDKNRGLSRGWVIFTGGEPALQLTQELVDAMHDRNWKVAVETNGTKPLPSGVDWISCSPKTAEHTLRVGVVNELRYVRSAEQGIPKPKLASSYYYLSPAMDPHGGFATGALQNCIHLCLRHPRWALSVQDHKRWRVR